MSEEKDNNQHNDNKSVGGLSGDPTIMIEWSPENEEIMVEWCDVAQCYKWLNLRAHGKYARLHAWFTIPAIILSTISGTASFAQQSFPTPTQPFVPMAIGSLNIFIGILTTIQQYLKISELNEAHRVSAISWDKFARNIRIELAKRPEERAEAGHFIKLCRSEFDRLMETSPTIPDKIIQEFTTTFQGKEGTEKRQRFKKLKKPDICSTIISADEIRHKWYLEVDKLHSEANDMSMNLKEMAEKSKDDLIMKQKQALEEIEHELQERKEKEIHDMEEQQRLLEENSKAMLEKRKHMEEEFKKINDYIESFEKMYDRKPLQDEIKENLIELETGILNEFLVDYAV